MTTADAILAFIRLCLNEDEDEARDAKERTTTSRRMLNGQMQTVTTEPAAWRRSVWPPDRVIADIAAKRRQLDIIETMLGEDPATTGMYAHQLLQAHAAAYRDRPGYREEWRP